MYIYAFFRICCRMSMHRQLRIRTLFSGGAHSDADTVVFSTFGKPLTASGLYIIARTKAFFRLTEEPFLCCGKGSSACQDVLSGEPLCALPWGGRGFSASFRANFVAADAAICAFHSCFSAFPFLFRGFLLSK